MNVLCDNALIGGFAAQVKPIPVEIVEDVCRDFDLLAGAVRSDDARFERTRLTHTASWTKPPVDAEPVAARG